VKHAAKTETLSISLSQEPLKLLRRRARQAHGGNLSAAIAEAAEFLRRDLALGDVVADLVATHGPLTDAERQSIDTELRGDATAPRRKKKRAA